jgi:hypothetical protein
MPNTTEFGLEASVIKVKIMSDPVEDAIRNIRVSVKIILSKSRVTPKNPASGLWPRITLESVGKSRTISLVNYEHPLSSSVKVIRAPSRTAPSRTQMTYQDFTDILTKEILVLTSGSSKTSLRYGRGNALAQIVIKIRRAVSGAVSRATRSKSSVAKRRAAAVRKNRKEEFLEKFRKFCDDHGQKVEYEDLRPSDLGKVWDDVRRMRVAEKIMES